MSEVKKHGGHKIAAPAELLKLQALKVIAEKECIYLSEIFAYTDYSQKTFYNNELHRDEEILLALSKNKIDAKADLRKQWRTTTNATAQIALYKLLGTEEELERLNSQQSRNDNSQDIQELIKAIKEIHET